MYSDVSKYINQRALVILFPNFRVGYSTCTHTCTTMCLQRTSLVSVVLESYGLLWVGWCHGEGSVKVLHTVTDVRHTVARIVLKRPRLEGENVYS